MYRRWHRFGFGLPPFGFWFRGPGCFMHRTEYIRMLEDYQRELKMEAEEVNKELEELKKTG
jgi:hypothetical protein